MRMVSLTRREVIQATSVLLSGLSISSPSSEAMTPTEDPPAKFVWKEIARGQEGPGARSRHCLTYDSARRATVLFGGAIWAGKDSSLCDDTWELKEGRWKLIDTAASPSPMHRGAMVYDRARGMTVLFGGQDPRNKFLGETWTYSGNRWQKLLRSTGPYPTARCAHSLCFDEEIGEVVLFGGVDSNERTLGDTWTFDGKTWKQVPGPGPNPREYAPLAYDAGLKGCLLHAGANEGAGTTFGDEWLFKSRKWTKQDVAFDTSPRDDQGMSFHKTANQMVMTEGLAGGRGLLVREAKGWRKAEVEPLHPRHQCAPMVWDDTLDGIVLHGGEVRQGGAQFDVTMVLKMAKI